MAAKSLKVKIACRIRPFLPSEVRDDGVVVEGDCISCVNPRDPLQHFKFNFQSCHGQDSSQESIFEQDVQPLLDEVFRGVTVTTFAYGVTSSGKTHTMQGTPSAPGIIPRVVQSIFETKASTSHQVSISVSYMEIYKDEVYDLLVPREKAPRLAVRENEEGKVVVAHLTEREISSPEDFDGIFTLACKSRSTAATNLNHASSRSHAVLTVHVAVLHEYADKTVTGKINLVDLAGSENNKLTGNEPSRMAESAAINKSLATLGQVVHALNQGHSRVPYRDSKLTRILQDALGGSSLGLLICNLAPGSKFRQDTLNTLNFATRTRTIENRPYINERDNRPIPKPHFAALAPPKPTYQPVRFGASSMASSSSSGLAPPTTYPSGRLSVGSMASSSSGGRRQAMAPLPVRSVSASGPMPTVKLSIPVPISSRAKGKEKEKERAHVETPVSHLSPSDDEYISPSPRSRARTPEWILNSETLEKAITKKVEEEVARRLAELSRPEPKEHTPPLALAAKPTGLAPATPSKHQPSLDEGVQDKLNTFEKRLERNDTDMQVAAMLSPKARKKTTKAFLALARKHQDDDELTLALELYIRAQTYAPENEKLRARIIEIKASVESGHTLKESKALKSSLGRQGGATLRPAKRLKRARTPEPPVGSDDEVEAALAVAAKKPRRGTRKAMGMKKTKEPADDEDGDEVSDVEWVERAPRKRRKAKEKQMADN